MSSLKPDLGGAIERLRADRLKDLFVGVGLVIAAVGVIVGVATAIIINAV